ncbi:MAG: TolC family protein [Desulfobacterales bacterium]|nr:TolC family protein [Desulfobacterales bacterium]
MQTMHTLKNIGCAATCALLWMGLTLGNVRAENGVMADNAARIDWDAIEILDIETAQRIGLLQNPNLRAASERVNQARERVRQAQAAYWPTVDTEGSWRREEISNNQRKQRVITGGETVRAGSDDDSTNIYRVEMITTWTVFDGFRRHYDNARARFGEEENLASLKEARRLLLSSIADNYYVAQLAMENIRIADADEEFNTRQLEEARARMRVGTGSLSDVLNFEVQVNAARSARNGFERDYRLAMIGLAALMGIPDAGLPDSLKLSPLKPETDKDLAMPPDTENIDYALEHRTDIQRDQSIVNQADAGVGIARARYWPALEFRASVDGEQKNSVDYEKDDFGSTVGLFLSYPLFTGGERRSRLAEAKYIKNEAEDNLDATRIGVASDVREAIANVVTAQRELLLQQNNAELVKRNRDLVDKEYNAGQASLVRLNEAQRDLNQATSQLALARVGLRQTWKNLNVATGRILQPFEAP